MKIEANTPGIFTIGHSSLTYEAFFALLSEHGIQYLVDVRSQPYSRHVPHFNRETVQAEAEARGVDYRFMGDALGGRPGDALREPGTGAPDYDAMAKEPALLRALDDVVGWARIRRVALMCSEGDPAACHRTKLLGKVLQSGYGVTVLHITQRGLVSQDDAFPEQLSLL